MHNWDSFAPHFLCNVFVHCEDGRDEDGCPRCHGAGFAVRERCYYLDNEHLPPYNEANNVCRKRGAQLVSFNTEEEMDAVVDFVCRNDAISTKFRVGLYMPAAPKSEL